MVGLFVVLFLLECYIFLLQEEVLVNFGGGWECSGYYNFDDIFSQNLLYLLFLEVQQYLLDLNVGFVLFYKVDSGLEFLEDEVDMGYMQEFVEWIFFVSIFQISFQIVVGVEDGFVLVKEDSYVVVFESDCFQFFS